MQTADAGRPTLGTIGTLFSVIRSDGIRGIYSGVSVKLLR
jgi:hypothetical protein